MKKYQIIYADPPWPYSAGPKSNGFASASYSTMGLDKICALPIWEIQDENCRLFLWTTNFFLPQALRVLHDWNFRYVTMLTWIKGNGGMGRYFQTNTEHILFGIKGKAKNKILRSNILQFKNPRKHSKKPNEVRDFIVEVSGNLPRIELFARSSQRVENGWVNVGNEVDGCDIRDSLEKIINGTYL